MKPVLLGRFLLKVVSRLGEANTTIEMRPPLIVVTSIDNGDVLITDKDGVSHSFNRNGTYAGMVRG